MRPLMLAAAVVVVFTGSKLQAGKPQKRSPDPALKAQIQALKGQIKDLRNREKADLRKIDDHFKARLGELIRAKNKAETERVHLQREKTARLKKLKDRRDMDGDKERDRERRRAERKKVEAEFNARIAAQTREIGAKDGETRRLREHTKAHKDRVGKKYRQDIKHLEDAVRRLERESRKK